MGLAVDHQQLAAVFGLGRSGLSTLRVLQSRGARVIGWDDQLEARRQAEAQGFEIADPQERLDDLSHLYVSPGVPLYGSKSPALVRAAQERGIAIEGDMDILADLLAEMPYPPRLIGITGTNGKSTTSALIAHLYAQAGYKTVLGGNIGVPILDTDFTEAEILVLELSSYQIELMSRLSVDVAILTNISPDHLDRHGTMANYVAAKEKLFSHVKMGGTAIIGIDGTDEAHIAQALTEQDVLTVQTVSVRDQAASLQYEGGRLLSQSGDVYRLDHLSVLPGRHNAQNAGLAILAGHALGVGHEDIQRGLESFHGLAHRLQPVAKAGKVLFVNDSKATNAEACVHALHAYDHIHWIAGGLAKSSGLAGVESALSHVSHAYLIGDAAQEFSGFLSAHGVAHQVDETLERAVHAAAKGAAAEGEAATVLLSPACASFDQFPNFEARGDAFCALVNTLVGAARDSEAMQ